MRAETRRLLIALLKQHRESVAKTPPPVKGRIIVSNYTIQYGHLCSKAGVPHIVRIVGEFLGEIAVWCQSNGFPPLNSLAVSSSTGMPGEGYDGAGGFLIRDWPDEVEQVIRFTEYPLEGSVN